MDDRCARMKDEKLNRQDAKYAKVRPLFFHMPSGR